MNKIKKRLSEFEIFFCSPVSWHYVNNQMILMPSTRSDNQRLFEELAFCLLTANTSAVMSMKAVDQIRQILFTGNYDDIRSGLVSAGYRFPNKRAEYISQAREKFSDNLKQLITKKDKFELREYLVSSVKGLGYKEASHFLRNVGVRGLAILDKHILKSMSEKGLIDEVPKSLNKKTYLEYESILKDYSNKENIDFDELDLLWWSNKNGEVLK
ncbi:MAG: N-glycosylase/DNA lyase [archaeon]